MTTLREVVASVESVGKPKKIANNTFKYTRPDGTDVIRLHGTDIIMKREGITTLDSGGWRTNTTRDRMTKFSGYCVHQDKGQWYVFARGVPGSRVPFYDGITLPVTANVRERARDVETSNAAMRKKINDFLRKTIAQGKELPIPNDGDCWFCRFSKTSGTKDSNTEHLLSHVEEGYMHGSLIVNAFRYSGYGDPSIQILAYSWRPDLNAVRRVLRKFLVEHLITE